MLKCCNKIKKWLKKHWDELMLIGGSIIAVILILHGVKVI